MNKRTWFVSHPSGSVRHTPAFFSAIETFAVEYRDIEFTFPHAKGEDVQLTRDAISAAELLLVEVSISSTGSGIEIGWAHAQNTPVIAFHQGGSDPSPAIKFVAREINVYVTEDHIINALKKLV